VETFPIFTVEDVSPVVLVKADAGIGARDELPDDEDDAAVVAVLELLVEEQAASVPPPTTSTASASAPRRRMPVRARRCSERSIPIGLPPDPHCSS